MSDTFLPSDEVRVLTGKCFKSQQIVQLRKMGLIFHVNATGHPVVPRAQFSQQQPAEKPIKAAWVPRVLQG